MQSQRESLGGIRKCYQFKELFWLISALFSKIGYSWNSWLSVFPSQGGQYFTVHSQGAIFHSKLPWANTNCSGKYICTRGKYWKSKIPIIHYDLLYCLRALLLWNFSCKVLHSCTVLTCTLKYRTVRYFHILDSPVIIHTGHWCTLTHYTVL